MGRNLLNGDALERYRAPEKYPFLHGYAHPGARGMVGLCCDVSQWPRRSPEHGFCWTGFRFGNSNYLLFRCGPNLISFVTDEHFFVQDNAAPPSCFCVLGGSFLDVEFRRDEGATERADSQRSSRNHSDERSSFRQLSGIRLAF